MLILCTSLTLHPSRALSLKVYLILDFWDIYKYLTQFLVWNDPCEGQLHNYSMVLVFAYANRKVMQDEIENIYSY